MLDNKKPTGSITEYMRNETRFRMVEKMHPERFKRLAREAQHLADQRNEIYEQMSHISVGGPIEATATGRTRDGPVRPPTSTSISRTRSSPAPRR